MAERLCGCLSPVDQSPRRRAGESREAMSGITEHVASCVCHEDPQKHICRYHAHPFVDIECEALSRGVSPNVVRSERQDPTRYAEHVKNGAGWKEPSR